MSRSRALGIIPVVLVALGSSRVSEARVICDCASAPFVAWTTPADGRTGVPVNTLVRVIVHVAPTEDPIGLECAGVSASLVEQTDDRNDYQQVLSARPAKDLPARATCTVFLGEEPQASFVTAAASDDSDPTWSGAFDRSHPRESGSSCPGWLDVTGIDPSGHEDDTTPAGDLLFELEPDDDTPAPVWGFDDALALVNGEGCVNMEPDSTPRSAYAFWIRAYDEAGNASEPYEIALRPCGCGSGGSAAGWLWTVALAACRRRASGA
jgi:hypothetical protein